MTPCEHIALALVSVLCIFLGVTVALIGGMLWAETARRRKRHNATGLRIASVWLISKTQFEGETMSWTISPDKVLLMNITGANDEGKQEPIEGLTLVSNDENIVKSVPVPAKWQSVANVAIYPVAEGRAQVVATADPNLDPNVTEVLTLIMDFTIPGKATHLVGGPVEYVDKTEFDGQ
jgi:hypothetical protein